ncbi:MAG: DUF5009 domain-containing protein, partial [Bacteroidales bacterium]|nr:DUF5009 domain-containing protein [Bacteroidales bacterium]
MVSKNRILSIDIIRGLTLLLMLFVNDLNINVVPRWLGHMEAGSDGMGLADWIFPGFLFIVGMAVPFALSKRFSRGDHSADISRHIITRSVSLIVIGVLMLNSARINAELTGLSLHLWALMMYIAVFLFWNDYPNAKERIYAVSGYKLAALAILIFLVFRFRSGEEINNGSLITGWWGILGLIGWGYLVTAFTYLLFRDSIWKTLMAVLFFLALNILSSLRLLNFLDPLQPYLGVLIGGNTPFIVLTGLLAGVILKKLKSTENSNIIPTFIALGMFCLISGFILRRWFIISKIQGTPSWGLICSGINFLIYILIHWIVDIKGEKNWAGFIMPAGQHSLTTYLATSVLY